MVDKGNTLWVGCKLAQALWKTVWRFLEKLKSELVYDPAAPLPQLHLEEMMSARSRDSSHP